MDVTLILSAVIFTLLAIVVATSLLKGSLPAANARGGFSRKGERAAEGSAKLNGHVAAERKKKEEDNWSEISGSSHDHWDVVKSTEGATESPGDNLKVESDANNSLKYVPGKARSHHLEAMMSKEELEEEQRVQREQLAAIFQLLKDNKETFGNMSEGDLEEQLRLYSI
ncbi:matrix-remodeling-associated protein 7-like isoform X2 [Cyprinodon tularosa]|uniref:matrix-remodeling-associated protein 7-like isoform X2 n=1 Tax=Cyprinodon tularosa TaxID=77115 RepID=UPI0018E21E4D|nr:matrix-remodeling-associated protein 7-like isoform X2 [Cyprinodon tularosa]